MSAFTPLSREEIAELRALEAKASTAPWIDDFETKHFDAASGSDSTLASGLRNASPSLLSMASSWHDLVEALERVEKGEGEYSRDPFTHACNTIEAAKTDAREALAKARGTEVVK